MCAPPTLFAQLGKRRAPVGSDFLAGLSLRVTPVGGMQGPPSGMELSSSGLVSCSSRLSKWVKKCLWSWGDGLGTLASCVLLLKVSRSWDGDLDVRRAVQERPAGSTR